MPRPKELPDHQLLYAEVGRRISEARKRRKPPLTQEALAGLVSLTRTSITNIEKGRQKFLLHTLAEIATAVQVPMAGLLPDADGGADHHLDEVLKHRSAVEKEWIKSTLSVTQKVKEHDGA